jgi:hypothetical protein
MEKKSGFVKDHSDTIAIIGVNLTMMAVLLTICLSNMSSIAAVNARMDASNARMDARMDTLHTMFYDLLKEGKK